MASIKNKIIGAICILLTCIGASALHAGEIPKMGDKAPDFTLKTLDDQTVRLGELTAKGKVVLVVLRGWPGYQCPICDRQVQDFVQSASAFAEAKVQVVFVYPGPASDLKAHAEEFKTMKGKQWPKDFLYVIDPDYTMVNAYNLRWNAPKETAYPSTFILDNKGVIRFEKISHGHGDRTKAADMLTEVKKISGMGYAQDQGRPRFKAVAFDYFVIFNPDSIIPAVEKVFPGKGVEFTRAWRAKLFDYSFLSSIAGHHEDFYKLTDDALVYTAAAMKLGLSPKNRETLLNAYLTLKPWPDTEATLRRLKASGIRVITISNFSGKMLRANADHAGVSDLFDDLLSTEVNGTFKPDPRAYALGMQTLNLKKSDILFVAFGGWDAYGAKSFGYSTYWVNRFNLPQEQIGAAPDQTSSNLEGLVNFILPAFQSMPVGRDK